eukprot:2014611-Amphidinium_carterae.1
MDEWTVSTLGKMNIKLPSPTRFNGRYPQLNEWSSEVKAYLGVHNVNIEDIMDDCTKSVTVIVLSHIQDKYTLAEVTKMNTNYPVAPADGDDVYDDYSDPRDTIRKMRGD